MGKQDEILGIIQKKGPVLPVHIAHDAKISLLFAGAYLSELSSGKKVIVSSLKVGSSPVYYVKGQEAKLENYIKYLERNEQAAVNQLKEEKILNDKDLPPVIRVALRQAKDFAIAVKVNLKTGQEHYWKWYLLPNEEAEKLIREHLKKYTEHEEKPEEIKHEEPETRPEEPETKQELPEIKPEEKQPKIEKPAAKKKPVTKKKKTITRKKKDIQKALIEKPKENIPEYKPETADALLELAKKHFKKLDIEVLDCETIMQGKELDLNITVSTTIGDIPYFCKIKKKTRSTENDLFATLLSAQKKGLPALYVATGTINKKAKEILQTKAHSIQFLSIKT